MKTKVNYIQKERVFTRGPKAKFRFPNCGKEETAVIDMPAGFPGERPPRPYKGWDDYARHLLGIPPASCVEFEVDLPALAE